VHTWLLVGPKLEASGSMKAAKTWCVAGLVVVAAFSSASCGKDEADGDGKGGSGVVLPTGGSAGNAGSGRGGSTPTAGTGGSSAAPSATKLGRGCIDDADCADTEAPGLKCIAATDTALGDGAPPKGLCTAGCTQQGDECAAFGADALCYPFIEGSNDGYCIEGCSFGEPELGAIKCHNRDEFACNPALLQDTGDACDPDADECGAGEVCINDTCAVVFPGCLPGCRGDIDCEDGMYCDQSFLNGTCIKTKPVGKALGEPCTVPADNEPNEPDECLGFCQADAATGNAGHCATNCGLLTQCGWNADTKKFDGACFFGSSLTAETGSTGDFGFCALSCNCSAECNNEKLGCELLTQGPLNADFRGPGLCFTPDAMTMEYDQCTGAGGTSAGGTGAGGEGNTSAGGAPSGEGGAGGGN
jgi:hypothetical protein